MIAAAPTYAADQYRNTITRCTVLLCLFFMAWRGACHGLLHQLQQPELFYTGYDLSYWLIRTLRLDLVLAQERSGALLLEGVFFGSGLLLLGQPRQRLWAFLFAGSFLLHDCLFNMYICKTPHVQAGFAIILWSFCARRFGQWWRAMRYYVCYIFFTAFVWKLWYGSFFQWDGGLLFFREQAAPYLFRHPDTALAAAYRFLILHPFLLNLGEKLLFAGQGLFVIGFFTKKYDRFFSLFLILFIVTLLLFGHHFFAEFLVLLLPLLRDSDWNRISDLRFFARGNAQNQNSEPII